MEIPRPFSVIKEKVTSFVQEQLRPPSPEELEAINAGTQMYLDARSGLLPTPDAHAKRLEQLKEEGVNVQIAENRFRAMAQADSGEMFLRR